MGFGAADGFVGLGGEGEGGEEGEEQGEGWELHFGGRLVGLGVVVFFYLLELDGLVYV